MALRICDITTFYSATHPGGVKRYLQAKQQYCIEHTADQHFTIVPDQINRQQTLHDRAQLYTVASPTLPWNPSYRFLMNYARLAKLLLEIQPDIIEMGCPYRVPWLVQRFYQKHPQLPRPQLIGFYHADFPRSDVAPLFAGLSQPLSRWSQSLAQRYAVHLYNHLDHCLVASPHIAQRLQSWGIQQVQSMPFGVDCQSFTPTQPMDASVTKLRLLFVGRLSADKGILPLIQLLHHLHPKRPEVELTIVGGGYQERRARQLANAAPYIHFVPFQYEIKSLAQIYSQHHLMLVPTPHETFCLSALEAMACGTPVATLYGSGGIETIIHPETGFLVGTEAAAFLPFLQQCQIAKLLAMRPQVRHYVTQHFEQQQRFQQLFQFYHHLRSMKPCLSASH